MHLSEGGKCTRPYFRGRQYPRRPKEEDVGANKDVQQSLKEVLSTLSSQSNSSDRSKLNYLNLFVKIALQIDGTFSTYGFKDEELMQCLCRCLLHPSTEVRSGTLRGLRHMIKTQDNVLLFNKLGVPFLVARSLDLVVKNDTERVEALKVMRRILVVSSDNFHISMARSLVALANGGFEEKNRMLRSCLGTLCEFGVLNPQLFITSGGVGAVTRNLLECQTPRIAESLCGVLLLLLDRSTTRNVASVDLHCVAAPYCDFHYRHNWKDKSRRDERELRFHSSRRALLTILQSWPGVIHFCSPHNKIGLRAIIEALYLDQLEIRKGILDLLYDLFGLPQPEWTDELSVGLSAIDPSEPNSSWRLSEGFVVAEGRSVLPHLAKSTPNTIEAHIALLLYCFLENGLLRALTEVIATGDTFISVRATVFLGEILRLMQNLLPTECCNLTPALPSLIEYAVVNKPQALGAITALQRLHKLLKKRPASYSLHLDYILRSGSFIHYSSRDMIKYKMSRKKRSKLPQFISKEEDNIVRETGVLLNKDAYTWDWTLIKILLRGENNFKLDLLDSSHKMFADQLIEFYMPSSNRYSHMDLGSSKMNVAYTTVAVDMVHCLISSADPEAVQLLLKLFMDILNHIVAISTSKSVHDCLFSPQHMINTQCQSYFLFIGQLGTTEKGINLLNSINMYEELEKLVTATNNDCYVKLVISSMNYSYPGRSRQLLSAVLTCQNESSRLYTTQFLLILLRAGIPDFASWGIKLLINQLQDESKNVQSSAFNILHEACEITDCLETLVKQMPDFAELGEKGSLLLVRLLSIPAGFDSVSANVNVDDVIKKWDEYFNYRYVQLIEQDISDALTLHRFSEDENKLLRSLNCKEMYLPPHLYGQISHHSTGFELIMSHGSTSKMIEILKTEVNETDNDILHLKASMWALGHLSNSVDGFKILQFHDTFADIVNLAEQCQTYSVRATAYYVLSLIASTQNGADALAELGWASTRHDRHNLYPVVDESLSKDGNSCVNYCGSSITEDDSFLSTDDEFTDSLDTSTDQHVSDKSSTSPERRSFSYHQRSLSETATFDMVRVGSKHVGKDSCVLHEQENRGNSDRIGRLNSSGKFTRFKEKTSTLGTIPSSPSFYKDEDYGRKIRRHSESCRRTANSGTNSNISLPFDERTARLKHEDVVGYATIRSLRKLDGQQSNCMDFSGFSDSVDLYSSRKHRFRRSTKHAHFQNPCLASLSSIKKYCVKGILKNKMNGYLGICLPVNILKLFPESYNNNNNDDSTNKEDMTDVESICDDSVDKSEKKVNGSDHQSFQTNSAIAEKFRYHRNESCLKCSQKGTVEVTNNSDCTMEFLRQVELLANPGWSKHVKQYLLEIKQKKPDVFQDLCLYSEVCHLIADNSYRLFPRRMLHELFLDCLYDSRARSSINGDSILGDDELRLMGVRQNGSFDSQRPLSGIKTLESLKLTYKENKFPIKQSQK